MIATCRFANMSQALAQYRLHANQATTARSQEQRALTHESYARQVAALRMSATALDLIRHESLSRCDGRRPIRENRVHRWISTI
jgi:hypothetical protein